MLAAAVQIVNNSLNYCIMQRIARRQMMLMRKMSMIGFIVHYNKCIFLIFLLYQEFNNCSLFFSLFISIMSTKTKAIAIRTKTSSES